MKIGVLTFWHGNGNYGMMLQCWAMQEVLKQMGHQPFVIRYAKLRAKSLPRRVLERLKLYNLFLMFTNPLEYELQRIKARHDKLRKFERFRQSNLKLSSKYYHSLQELQNEPPIADSYIVGSDQVWSQVLNCTDNEAYFLYFGSLKIKRMSYAPSFGFTKYPQDYLTVLKNALGRFDTISCREQSGVDICKQLGFEATKVLDPTLLLDKQVYQKKALECQPLTKRPYVFIYSLNIQSRDEIRFKELEAYIKQQQLDLVVTPADGYCQGLEIFGQEAIYSYSTIEQWLSNILNASFVVTPSFHGIVLSIILEKPFVYVPLIGRHSNSNGRILEVLNVLGLNNRILRDGTSYSAIICEEINWNVVKDRLEREKELSFNYLSILDE